PCPDHGARDQPADRRKEWTRGRQLCIIMRAGSLGDGATTRKTYRQRILRTPPARKEAREDGSPEPSSSDGSGEPSYLGACLPVEYAVSLAGASNGSDARNSSCRPPPSWRL